MKREHILWVVRLSVFLLAFVAASLVLPGCATQKSTSEYDALASLAARELLAANRAYSVALQSANFAIEAGKISLDGRNSIKAVADDAYAEIARANTAFMEAIAFNDPGALTGGNDMRYAVYALIDSVVSRGGAEATVMREYRNGGGI